LLLISLHVPTRIAAKANLDQDRTPARVAGRCEFRNDGSAAAKGTRTDLEKIFGDPPPNRSALAQWKQT
jgi:hypothetical protein